MKKITRDELSMNDDYCYLHDGEPFSGHCTDIVHGRKVGETYFRRGMKHGQHIAWDWEEGYLKWKTHYVNNTLHGIDQCWYEFGQRKSLIYREHGVTTHEVVWDQFGEIVDSFKLNEHHDQWEILMGMRKLYGEEAQPENWEEQKPLLEELEAILTQEGWI